MFKFFAEFSNRVRVKILKSKVLEWLTFLIEKLTNAQMYNGWFKKVTIMENENWKDYDRFRISIGQTIQKLAIFWNFDSVPNLKKFEILLIFQIIKFLKFVHS